MTKTVQARAGADASSAEKGGGRLYVLRRLLAGRLRPLWITALMVWGTFVAFRGGLLLARLDGLRGVDAIEILRCFMLGMRYDAMPMGYLLLPMAVMLSVAPRRAFGGRGLRRAVTAWGTAVVLLVIATEIIGAAFYLHFGLRLNWMALYYMQYPHEVMTFISENYPLWLFLVILAALVYGGYRLLRRLYWGGRGAEQRDFALDLGGRVALTVVLTFLGVLACRGGADHRPLRRGSAYISYNNLVNQLTMNNFFTFFNAVKMQVTDNRDEGAWYALPPRDDAVRVAGEMLFQPGRDVSLGTPNNGLWRRSVSRYPPLKEDNKDYNVVLILMEGMAGRPVGALGNADSCTPNLDALCRKGVFFSNMHAVGARTSRGVMGVLCGHPDIGGQTILKRSRTARSPFLTLPSVLRRRGYETMFIYGGDPKFDNMETFFTANGMDTIVGQDQIDKAKANTWGVPDEYIFDKAHKTFSEVRDRPFFGLVLTVSNHEPYEVPEGRTSFEQGDTLDVKIRNAYRYADWALGEFFRKAETSEYYERTIFLLVADHGVRLDHRPILDAPGYRIPCLMYAPGLSGAEGRESPRITQPQIVNTLCSQVDVSPTIMALLGGAYEHCFLGRDVMSVSPDDGFAFIHEDDRLGLIRGDRVLVLPPLCDPVLYERTSGRFDRIRSRDTDPDDVHKLKLQLLSYYGTARDLYLTSSYHSPVDAHTGGPQMGRGSRGQSSPDGPPPR